MSFNRTYKNQDLPFHQFEKSLAPLLGQSRNFLINFHQPPGFNKNNCVIDTGFCSVNGCNTPAEFQEKMTFLMESSLWSIFKTLECTHISNREPLFEHIRIKAAELLDIVGDDSMTVNDGLGEFTRQHPYKCFKDFRLVGFKKDFIDKYSQSLHLTIGKYAIVWIEVISSLLDQLDFVHEILLSPQPEDPPSNTSNFKIRLNLSVTVIGRVARILEELGIIVVPPRHLPKYREWITQNIQSIKCDDIQSSSMRKNFYSDDAAALDSIEDIAKKVIQAVHEARERDSR
jgi:hypothetical protein